MGVQYFSLIFFCLFIGGADATASTANAVALFINTFSITVVGVVRP